MQNPIIATLSDLRKIPVLECKEPAGTYENPIVPRSRARDGQPVPAHIIVRQTLVNKLNAAQKALQQQDPLLKLVVLEGLRAAADQAEHFEKILQKLAAQWPHKSKSFIEEQAHLQIAEPSVAGHPTGGAVDVTIYRRNKELDFKGQAGDVDNNMFSYTWADGLTKAQLANRLLLQNLMQEQGFAPFYAEWWHFSHGDREWAFFYGQPCAVYGPLTVG